MAADTDPVLAAREAHRATCAACGDVLPCAALKTLTDRIRQAEREARNQVAASRAALSPVP